MIEMQELIAKSLLRRLQRGKHCKRPHSRELRQPANPLVDIGYKPRALSPSSEFDDVDEPSMSATKSKSFSSVWKTISHVILLEEPAAYRQNSGKRSSGLPQGDGLIKSQVVNAVRQKGGLTVNSASQRLLFFRPLSQIDNRSSQ